MPLDPKFLRADELGIRLEVVSGLPIWEAHPVWKHQKAVNRIRSTIAPKLGSVCTCVHASDVYVQFPDGSLKRPDVAIFCREPDETEDAISLVPERSSRWSARATKRKIWRSGHRFIWRRA